jgi:hypothetical protein
MDTQKCVLALFLKRDTIYFFSTGVILHLYNVHGSGCGAAPQLNHRGDIVRLALVSSHLPGRIQLNKNKCKNHWIFGSYLARHIFLNTLKAWGARPIIYDYFTGCFAIALNLRKSLATRSG